MFRFYFRKIIVCPATYIGAVLLFLSMVLSLERGNDFAQPALLLDCVFAMGFSGWFLPVAAVLPISYLRHTMQKGGAWQFPLMHSSPIRYTSGGLAAAFVSGALVLLLAAGLFHLYVILFLKGPVSYQYVLHGETYFYSKMSHRVYYLVMIGIYAVNAGMYALIAYGVSGFSANQYLCAASGFAFWIVASLLIQTVAQYVPERYALAVIALDPGQCEPASAMSETRDGGMLHLVLYVLVIAILSGGSFLLRLKRRLNNG